MKSGHMGVLDSSYPTLLLLLSHNDHNQTIKVGAAKTKAHLEFETWNLTPGM